MKCGPPANLEQVMIALCLAEGTSESTEDSKMNPRPQLPNFHLATPGEGTGDDRDRARARALSLGDLCYAPIPGGTRVRDEGSAVVKQRGIRVLAVPGRLLACLCLSFPTCTIE